MPGPALAPHGITPATVQSFAASRLEWVRKQRLLVGERQEHLSEYRDGERHLLWGEPHRPAIQANEGRPVVARERGRIVIRCSPGVSVLDRSQLLERWYGEQVRDEVMPLLAHWSKEIGAALPHLIVRQLKMRWGSCSHTSGRVRLNALLAAHPRRCLEGVVVHELVHLIEPSHGARFRRLMDRFLPDWRDRAQDLKRSPAERAARPAGEPRQPAPVAAPASFDADGRR